MSVAVSSRPDPVESTSEQGVTVLERRLPGRVRRPADMVALVCVLFLLVVVIGLADLAVGTADALESDLFTATDGLPRVLLTMLAWAGGIGAVVLPVAFSVISLVQGRFRAVIDAVLATAIAAGLTLALSRLILDGHLGTVLGALTRPLFKGRTAPLDQIVTVLCTFVVVCRVRPRRWRPWAWLVIASAMLTGFLSGSTTALAQIISVLLGWLIGLVFRVAVGTTSSLPSGDVVADSLKDTGLPLVRLTRRDKDDIGDREYVAASDDGRTFDVLVVDRDTFGSASVRSVLHRARLRSALTRTPALSVKAEIEHRALMSMTLERLDIPARRLVAAVPVSAFAAALVLDSTPLRDAQPLSTIGGDATDEQLKAVWQMLQRMQEAQVCHRSLSPSTVLVGPDYAAVADAGSGDIVAEDLALRLDLAQLLTTVALAVGSERALSSAIGVLGVDHVAKALPILQKQALDMETRAALKRTDDDLLDRLRTRLDKLTPDDEMPLTIELRRVTAKGVVMAIGLCFAAYLLLGMLGNVDVGKLISEASWPWALACVGFAILTFIGPSLSINGAVEAPLSLVRTYMVQLAVAFSGLVAPAAIGNIALNTRYLTRAGLAPALAGATIGVVQVAQMCSYFLLIILSGVLAGTGSQASFAPPDWALIAVPIVVLLLLALMAVPTIRDWVKAKVMPQLRLVGPHLLSILQHPRKLAMIVIGSLTLDAAFVGALVCATKAFGGEAPIPAIAVVYFAGAIVGSAVPTPGGIGGIEAAISAGLIAIGIPSGIAVSSVLLYRLATYWLPIPFGWLALNHLTSKRAI